MRRFAAMLAWAGVALALASAAAASLVVGVAEDATKYAPDGGAALFATFKANGLSSNRVSVFWDFTDPTTIEEKGFLDRLVPAAADAGVQLVFAIYADPRIPGGVRAVGKNPGAFCNYAAEVARTYPTVTKIIVGNEPNQPRFWQPQFDARGRPVAAAQFERVLARCYDALKAVNPDIDVIGVGLSPRGNDKPKATSNVSRSPVRFLHDLGEAYRASGRQLPLMDEFAFHCYPNVNTDAVSKGYPWPDVGCVNLGRLKQALWDAFEGTAQPTPPEGTSSQRTTSGTSGFLPLVIDETGWQVTVRGKLGYSGAENVPTISDAKQAQYYAQLVGIAACDPAITAFHFLYFLDSPQLADFQSGMEDVDGKPRSSASTVKAAIAQGCVTAAPPWRHASSVVGGRARRQRLASGRATIALTAQEGFSYEVVFGDGGARADATARRSAAVGDTKTVVGDGKPNWSTSVIVPRGFRGGTATVTLTAWANSARTTTVVVKL